ncbi:PorT family protein [bacterium]|nr:PorT family protein [bacterium]
MNCFRISALVALFVFSSAKANALVDFGVKGGLTNTRYSLFGDTSSETSFGSGYTVGMSLDIGALGLGFETGLYYARRSPILSVAGVESTYQIDSLEIPLLFRQRFAGLIQTGVGLLYRRMVNPIALNTYGFEANFDHETVGLRRNDMALLVQLGLRMPLALIALTAELRGFIGLNDLSTEQSWVSSHSVGGDVLFGVVF